MVVSYLAAACLARFRPSMSIFFICIIAFMTLCDTAGSGSLRSSGSAVGTICHDRPNLSLSQPHICCSPPAESFSHSSSTSFWVLQFTTNDTACENLNCGPPFKAMNSCPSSWNTRSEEHTSELQSQSNLVCRLLLEKKKNSIIALISVQLYRIVLVY